MNAVIKGLADVQYRIPKEIIQLALKEATVMANAYASTDEKLLAAIIRPRALVDMNIVGGVSLSIDLSRCTITSTEYNDEFIIVVPKTLTANRSILSANTIYTRPVGQNNFNTGTISRSNISTNTTLLDMGGQLISGYGTEGNILTTSRLEVIGENTIIVQERTGLFARGSMECTVVNSMNLENIKPASYIAVGKLFTLCVKAWIYNTLIIKKDKGYLYHGQELPIINEKIDEYAEMEEMYTEYIETTWRKIAAMNDTRRYGTAIQQLMGY